MSNVPISREGAMLEYKFYVRRYLGVVLCIMLINKGVVLYIHTESTLVLGHGKVEEN